MRIKGQKIYIWRAEQLVSDLAVRRVSELQKLVYLTSDVSLILFLLYVFTPPSGSDVVMYVEGLIVLLIAILGIAAFFRKNGGSKGRDFLDYFVCLALPVFVKVNVFVWLVYTVLFQVTGVFLASIPSQYYDTVDLLDEIVTSLSVIIAALAFFVLMVKHVGKIRVMTAKLGDSKIFPR